jgi:hypothetical protein
LLIRGCTSRRLNRVGSSPIRLFLPNIVAIISRVWLTWLRLGPSLCRFVALLQAIKALSDAGYDRDAILSMAKFAIAHHAEVADRIDVSELEAAIDDARRKAAH